MSESTGLCFTVSNIIYSVGVMKAKLESNEGCGWSQRLSTLLFDCFAFHLLKYNLGPSN